MAKKKAASVTPGQKAYAVVLDAIEGEYDEYAAGEAEDDDFTTPGKQKKVAKQLAKHHNRILKKSKLDDREELDEDV
jgi:hypothetical protein